MLNLTEDYSERRFEKLQKQREEIERCEAKFVQAATVVRNINKQIFSKPKETLEEANKIFAKFK